MAGGAVYLVYDQELLGPSDKSEAALRKAEEVVPPAMYQFSQYVCQQTGLEMPQVPWLGVSMGLDRSVLGGPAPPPPLPGGVVSLGLGDKAVTYPHAPASPVLLFLPSSQPLHRLTSRTSVTPGTQVGASAPARGRLGTPASLPAPFALLFLSIPPLACLCASMSPMAK